MPLADSSKSAYWNARRQTNDAGMKGRAHAPALFFARDEVRCKSSTSPNGGGTVSNRVSNRAITRRSTRAVAGKGDCQFKTAWRRMRRDAGPAPRTAPKMICHTMAMGLRAAAVAETEI